MLKTLSKQRNLLLGGLVATACAGGLAYWLERENLRQASSETAVAQIERIRERLSSVQMEMDAVLSMLSQAEAKVSNFEPFVARLTLSRNAGIRWVVGGVIDVEQQQPFEAPLATLLGRPDFKFAKTSENIRYLMPVLASRGKWPPTFIGSDLSNLPDIYGDVGQRVEGRAPVASNFDILSIQSQPFSSEALWYIGTVPEGLRFDNLPAAPLYVLRGVSLDTLRQLANTGPNQELQISIEGSQLFPTAGKPSLPSAAKPVEDVTRRLSFGANVLTVSMTSPEAPRLPRKWILVGLLGLATTAFAASMRMGRFVAESARSLSRDLESTQLQLDATNFRETAFFENTSTASAETEAASGKLLRVNQALCDMLGYSKAELIGKRFVEITHPADVQESLDALNPASAEPGKAVQFEKRYVRKDGSVIWGLVRTRLVQDLPRNYERYLTTIVDITDRKNDEITRNNLVRELAHRVRNTVQIMSSLARQTARTSRSVAEFDNNFRSRLAAMSVAQDVLFDTEWRGAPFKSLVERTLAHFFGSGRTFDMPSITIPAQHAQTLAIAIHELASNALRASGGQVFSEIDFTARLEQDPQDGERKIRMIWREPMAGRKRQPSRRGLGHLMLLTALPEQFEGRAHSWVENDVFVYEAWLRIPDLPS